MTATPEDNRALIEMIIEKQSSILGKPVAIRRARNVTGLEVSDDGKVVVIPDGINQAIADLVGQYKALSGSVGLNICKQAALSWLNSHASSTLPPIFL